MRGNIGKMDRKVTIQSKTVTIDGYGGQSEAYADLYTVWSGYTPQTMTGTTLTDMSDQPQFLEKAVFTIRYKDIPRNARLVYNGAIWKIIGVSEIGRKDRLQIAAVKTDSNLFD